MAWCLGGQRDLARKDQLASNDEAAILARRPRERAAVSASRDTVVDSDGESPLRVGVAPPAREAGSARSARPAKPPENGRTKLRSSPPEAFVVTSRREARARPLDRTGATPTASASAPAASATAAAAAAAAAPPGAATDQDARPSGARRARRFGAGAGATSGCSRRSATGRGWPVRRRPSTTGRRPTPPPATGERRGTWRSAAGGPTQAAWRGVSARCAARSRRLTLAATPRRR
jgi:hypothetical protein